MLLKNLLLHNFRNYRDQNIEFSANINILQGENGQGKTNILECIYYLLTGKSMRIRSESELVLWGEKDFYVKADFYVNNRRVILEGMYQEPRKAFLINGIPCKRLSDYVGLVHAVFFSPEDLGIIKKGPQERRRYLDLIICQHKPSHIALLNSYNKLMKQKSALLKKNRLSVGLKDQLEIWNEKIAEVGIKIIENRALFVMKLDEFSKVIFADIFSKNRNMIISYAPLGKKDYKEAMNLFPVLLQEKIDAEIERRSILLGPHRDDLSIEIDGRQAKYFASQGQQRCMILSLKLAELEIINNEKGEYPILLLDDVLSELDFKRREYLLRFIDDRQKQTIMTVTDEEKKMCKNDSASYLVNQGKIRRMP